MTRVGTFEFEARLQLHPGSEPWHFIHLPTDVSDDIADLTSGTLRGFGSVRVAVTVGGTAWRTSVFPDRRAGTFLLPVKKSVRAAEGLVAGDDVRVHLEVVGVRREP